MEMRTSSYQIFQNKKGKRSDDDTFLSKLTPLFKSGVEYVGLINEQGRFVDAIYKKPLNVPVGQLEMFFMGLRLQWSMQKDFDESMGSLVYVLVQRKDVKILSIPILSFIVVVIARKTSNHQKIVEKIALAVHDSIKQKNVLPSSTDRLFA